MGRKGFAQVIFVVTAALLVAGLIGYFWFYKKSGGPSSSDTANWKVYQSDDFGIEFKYPADLQVEEQHPTLLPYRYEATEIALRKDSKDLDPFIILGIANDVSIAAHKPSSECGEGGCPFIPFKNAQLACEQNYKAQPPGTYDGTTSDGQRFRYTVSFVAGQKACSENTWRFLGESVSYKEVVFYSPTGTRFEFRVFLGSGINRDTITNATDIDLKNLEQQKVIPVGSYDAVQLMDEIISTFTFIEHPAQSLITWKSIVGTNPLKEITLQNGGSIGIYDIGVFNQGPYEGKHLYFAEQFQEFEYFVGDENATPAVWFRNEIQNLPRSPIGDALNLTNLPTSSYSNLPAEIGSYYSERVLTDSAGNALDVDAIHYDLRGPGSPEYLPGAKIYRDWIFKDPYWGYKIETPFGMTIPASPAPNFIDSNGIAQIRWDKGGQNSSSYEYSQYAINQIKDRCDFNFAHLKSLITKTGVTSKGDPVFEAVDPPPSNSFYVCLSKLTPASSNWETFSSSHPIFFWRHGYGDWLTFVREDFISIGQ